MEPQQVYDWKCKEERNKWTQAGRLARSTVTIAAIAYECGFNSLATFQRCFKQFTGITPSKYQNTLNADLTYRRNSDH
jgi:AraC-like DNA-binding protein